MAAAVPASRGRLNAMIPPNADVGSVVNARSYASRRLSPIATPHGFACFTITQAGSSKLFTHSRAASVSATLLKESALPWICFAVATLASAPARST